MQLFLALFLSRSFTLLAQADTGTGISFEKQLSLREAFDKAKAENKFLFVDCFTSWCGPCKSMDEDVYPTKEVGDYFNTHFISIRLQLDRTPHDDERVKSLYESAASFEKDYQINAYPTYLFFDSSGMVVHKAIGAVSAARFIGIGKNALDPQKQYYTVAKKFKPGILDTAELKGLARLFRSTDPSKAGSMVADYLKRIPSEQLGSNDNLQLIAEFYNDSAVLSFARGYIKGLQQNQLCLESNLDLVQTFREDSIISLTAKKYILNLDERQLYISRPIISFVRCFTDTITEPGFAVFYHHSKAIDQIMGIPHYAQNAAMGMIYKSEFNPSFDSSKQLGIPPDFSAIHTRVLKKYGKTYADEVLINGKLSWYKWLVRTKEEDKYWPEFLQARVAFIQHYQMDTVTDEYYINNGMNVWCYEEFFEHSDDTAQLQLATNWMKLVINLLPKHYDVRDTYACLLYKAGRTEQAIEQEEKALIIATHESDKQHARHTIEKMQAGEKIWLEKEFQ